MIASSGYTERAKSLYVKLLIEEKEPLDPKDPREGAFREALRKEVISFVPEELIDRFEIFRYTGEDYLIHEEYDNSRHFLFCMLEGTAICSHKGRFLSYKKPGQLLGTVGVPQDMPHPSATIVPRSKEVIAARLELTPEVRAPLLASAAFTLRLARDLAETIVENNAYMILSNSHASMLAAYIMLQTDGGKELWTPSKSEVIRDLGLHDLSQLNKLISAFVSKEKLILAEQTEQKVGRSARSTYQVIPENLAEELRTVDYRLLKNKFLAY